MPFKFKFGSVPEQNITHLIEDKSINGYKIMSHDKKQELYHITAKTATTRGKYRFRRVAEGDNVGLGSIVRSQIQNEYIFYGTLDEEFGKLNINDDGLVLHIAEDEYKGKSDNRAQNFVFYDDKNKLVLTVDKKLLSFNDKYEIRGVENFPFLIAQMIAVAIDDFYHS